MSSVFSFLRNCVFAEEVVWDTSYSIWELRNVLLWCTANSIIMIEYISILQTADWISVNKLLVWGRKSCCEWNWLRLIFREGNIKGIQWYHTPAHVSLQPQCFPCVLFSSPCPRMLYTWCQHSEVEPGFNRARARGSRRGTWDRSSTASQCFYVFCEKCSTFMSYVAYVAQLYGPRKQWPRRQWHQWNK